MGQQAITGRYKSGETKEINRIKLGNGLRGGTYVEWLVAVADQRRDARVGHLTPVTASFAQPRRRRTGRRRRRPQRCRTARTSLRIEPEYSKNQRFLNRFFNANS